jgi:hypothetical protein
LRAYSPVAVGEVLQLRCIDVRVPYRGELYLGHDRRIHRLQQDRRQSSRSKPMPILKEIWLAG